MQTIKQTLQAGQTWRVAQFAKFFQLFEASAPVNIRFLRQGKVVAEAEEMGAGFYSEPAEGFDSFEVTSTVAQTIKIGHSDGTAGTARITGDVAATIKGASSVLNQPMLTVNTVEVLVATARADRIGLRVLNAGASTLYIGAPGLNVADAVIALQPGEIWLEHEAPGAAWVAISSQAGGTLKRQELIL